MKAAFVTKWTTPIPGRERAGITYSRDVDAFFAKKAADGVCSEPTWLWAPMGEHLWFVEGEYEALLGLMAEPEVQGFLLKGTLLVNDFGYGLYRVGREEQIGPYEAVFTDLAIA